MLTKAVLSFLLFGMVLDVTLACNGYKVKVLKSENCIDDPVVAADPEFTLKLNKKCEFIPTGCVVNKAFKTAVAKYKVTKDGVVVKEGKGDVCSMAGQAPDNIKKYMEIFGAPTSCPVEAGKVCGNDNKIDITPFKTLLSLARGVISIHSDITHDTGKSCINVEIEVTK
ncbi:uncharacterized protein LOC109612441 [Musca domestica]|uniref:Uncharacterized protein LOC109612441 n=1 Tax=Musca domestica TaxID=7370 RepID=A0A9J7ID66_MUSDO|nr:uncharacterized protein LOC109612441 [Musca domestica]